MARGGAAAQHRAPGQVLDRARRARCDGCAEGMVAVVALTAGYARGAVTTTTTL